MTDPLAFIAMTVGVLAVGLGLPLALWVLAISLREPGFRPSGIEPASGLDQRLQSHIAGEK